MGCPDPDSGHWDAITGEKDPLDEVDLAQGAGRKIEKVYPVSRIMDCLTRGGEDHDGGGCRSLLPVPCKKRYLSARSGKFGGVNKIQNKMGQRGFEPQSKRPKRSRIDQATLLSRSVALTY